MKNSKNMSVVLDLSKDDFSDAAILEKKNLLHQPMMEQFLSIWNKLYDKAQAQRDRKISSDELLRCHNAISITASRGAGKTTFLLSVLHAIKHDKEKSVLCLKPIDPSLVEMKQHPFINIIAAIQEEVELYFSKNEYCNGNRSEMFIKKEFEHCYHKLLKALPFIDGVGKSKVYEEWDDDEFIAARGMERAEASNNLEVLFHDYVKIVLKVLDKTCLVISFDDIDTDFKKGYDVLESIRKYLTSPQIVTIITGDLELYGKLVRKFSWKGFDMAYLRKEMQYAGRSQKEFAQMVDQLENQYLVKLLKPEYRISLKTIREYLLDNNFEIKVKFSDNDVVEIREVYERCVDKLGFSRTNAKTKNEIIDFLLGLTLRVQVRIFTLYRNNLAKESDNSEIAQGLANVFWNDLSQKSGNAKSLLKVTPTYPVEMLKFLVENNILHSTTNFLPETNDFIINKALLVIGSQFNHILDNCKFLVFDYWLRICFVKAATERLGGKERTDVLRKFLDFTQLDADAGINKSYGMAQAYCNQLLNGPFYQNYELIPGTLFVGNQPPLQLMNNNRIMSLLPMLGTVDNNQREHVFASIYQLFAVIREALFVLYSDAKDGFRSDFVKLAQYRNYQEPFIPNQALPVNEPLKRLIESFEDIEEKANIEHLVKNLIAWSKMKVNVSCHLLDRVFTRFYYTLIHIDLDKGLNFNELAISNSVGDKLSLYILALLNAALVEDAIDDNLSTVNFNNVGDIESIYIQNIVAYKKEKQKNDKEKRASRYKESLLHEWLMKCPILTIFINPIIVQLQGAFEAGLISQVDYLLRLHRAEKLSVSFENKKTELEVELKNMENMQAWLDAYYEWKEKKDHYNFSMQYIDVDSSRDGSKELKKYRDSLLHSLNTLKKLVNPDGYTYRTPQTVIEQQYGELDKQVHEIRNQIELLEKRLTIVHHVKDRLFQDVKMDYGTFSEYINSRRVLILANNVYENLSKIKLSKL